MMLFLKRSIPIDVRNQMRAAHPDFRFVVTPVNPWGARWQQRIFVELTDQQYMVFMLRWGEYF